jgi:hypothetical protein
MKQAVRRHVSGEHRSSRFADVFARSLCSRHHLCESAGGARYKLGSKPLRTIPSDPIFRRSRKVGPSNSKGMRPKSRGIA